MEKTDSKPLVDVVPRIHSALEKVDGVRDLQVVVHEPDVATWGFVCEDQAFSLTCNPTP